ncbi:MAG: GIN domain-containing protein [Flavobacterium sp.]
MKKIIILIIIFNSIFSFSQKTEKIKASKNVTISQKELIPFKKLELCNHLDVILIKGNECKLEIEADDNLHETFTIKNTGDQLVISNQNKISGSKKMLLKLTYNEDLESILIKDDVKLTSIHDFENSKISITAYNDSKLKLGIKNKNTTINCYDNSKFEVAIITDEFTLNTINDSEFEADISSLKSTISCIDKSSIEIKGTTEDLALTCKDSSDYKGKKFISATANVNCKGKSLIEINCKNNLILNAINNSKIELFGTPKIQIDTFDGEVLLQKKVFNN